MFVHNLLFFLHGPDVCGGSAQLQPAGGALELFYTYSFLKMKFLYIPLYLFILLFLRPQVGNHWTKLSCRSEWEDLTPPHQHEISRERDLLYEHA